MHLPGIFCRERHERDAQERGGRLRRGELSTTEGPFGETNEQLGGFLLITAGDLNEAIQVPQRSDGPRSIEVRPIKELRL